MTCRGIKISIAKVFDRGQVNHQIALVVLGDDVKARLGCIAIIHMVTAVPSVYMRLSCAMNRIVSGTARYVIVAIRTRDRVVARVSVEATRIANAINRSTRL